MPFRWCTVPSGRSVPGAVPPTETSRSGFGKGSGSSITVLTTANIPAVAPIASPITTLTGAIIVALWLALAALFGGCLFLARADRTTR